NRNGAAIWDVSTQNAGKLPCSCCGVLGQGVIDVLTHDHVASPVIESDFDIARSVRNLSPHEARIPNYDAANHDLGCQSRTCDVEPAVRRVKLTVPAIKRKSVRKECRWKIRIGWERIGPRIVALGQPYVVHEAESVG